MRIIVAHLLPNAIGAIIARRDADGWQGDPARRDDGVPRLRLRRRRDPLAREPRRRHDQVRT
ncbi:MAG: hypothetical protein ABR569_12200 [Gaiellaceae bacterium]